MLQYFTQTLPIFAAWFGGAVTLAVAFLALYTFATPHREFALIRDGNNAAAVQLTGTFLGFAVPMAIVVGHAVSIPDMLMWGAVAAFVQLAIFVLVSRFLFPAISQRITDGCTASGTFIGGMGLGFGILQAACMVP